MRPTTLAILVATAFLCSCDVLDPARPTAHPDTEIFGYLVGLENVEGDEPVWIARVQIGMPRDFLEAEEQSGKATPTLDDGIVADVLVTSDTVVLAGGQSGFVEDINPGTEVAVIPVAGTTRMMGTSNVAVEAGYFLDFESFRRWRLPGLERETDSVEVRSDPSLINSDGVERAPVPIGDGSVLYFTARLRPPTRKGQIWLGAVRSGLREPEEGESVVERSYRTEITEDGWLRPEQVSFEGLDSATTVSVTWVDDDETNCLVTVEDESGAWVALAARTSAEQPWGAVDRVDEFGEAGVSDAVYLAGSRSKFVCTVRRAPGIATDLWLYDPRGEQPAMPLQPEVNTPASEKAPRVGPANELFFVRGDRQYVLVGESLHPVRAPGPHRIVVTEAAPTGNGKWVFMSSPHFTSIELDQDLYVAEWLGEGRIGELILVDEWRPY